MSAPLTHRQRDVLLALQGWMQARGYAPSFREMMRLLNIASPNGVHTMLDALEARGAIRRLRFRARAIEIVRPIEGRVCFVPTGDGRPWVRGCP